MNSLASDSSNRPIWRKFIDFWFAPVDPTPLGFIRIVTGCLIVYLHLAYWFDLTAFFGEKSWYGLKYIDRERKEFPYAYPQLGWDDPPRSMVLPEFPHRKRALMAYIRALITKYPNREQLDPTLKYFDRLHGTNNPAVARDGIAYVFSLSTDETFRRNQLATVADEKSQINDPIPPPVLVTGMTPEERKLVAAEIDAFYRTLPQDSDGDARKYIINHFASMDLPARAAWLKFARDLTAVDAGERESRLNYLEYWGVESRFADRFGSPIFSLWFHITDPTTMSIAHTVVLIIMVLFTLGFCTRVTSILTWLAAISYIHRTQQVLFGMDTMMNILLFYLMIGDSGAAMSIDRLVRRYRAIRASLKRTGQIDAATQRYLDHPPPSVMAGFALRLIQVHFCFIYMAAGMSKLKGAAWWNANAYWDTLVNPEFTMIQFEWYESMVRSMVSNRWLFSILAAGSVAFTLFLEFSLPFLVWTRMRWVVVIGAMFLHAGIAVFMGLWIFSLMMTTMLLAYIPGVAIRQRIFGEPTPTERIPLRFHTGSEAHTRAAALARTCDFDEQLELHGIDSPAPSNGVTLASSGQQVSGDGAAKMLFGRLNWLRTFRGLLLIPGISGWLTRAFGGVSTASSPTVKRS